MSIYVKHNNEIKSAVPYVKHNGEIKIPTSGWAKTGGALEQIWPPSNTVLISSQSELKAFCDRVNAGETSLNVKLLADITLTDSWTEVGGYSNQYTGTFDGGGHTITGLTISGSSQYPGLFGWIGKGGTVKNVKLASTSVTGVYYAGAIAGYNGGTVLNCTNEGDVTVTGSSSYAGGIVGINSGTVQNCTNSATVTGSGYVGGIVGMNNGGTVSDNTNTGAVTGTGTTDRTGGIVGTNNGGIVSGNINTGTVTATGTSGYAGGIVGYSSGTVSGNINTGTVTGTNIITLA